MSQIVDEFLSNIHPKARVRALGKRPDLLEMIKQKYPDVEELDQLKYLYVNGFAARPICVCGKPCSWLTIRYAKTCSRGCANKVGSNIAKMQTRCIEKYGVENVATLEITKSKRKDTMIAKYGKMVTDKHVSLLPETAINLNKKGRETLLEKYNVANPANLPDHGFKVRNTLLERYGPGNMSRGRKEQITKARYSRLNEMLTECEVIDVTLPMGRQANLRYTIRCICGSEETLASETFKFRVRKTGSPCTICSGLSTSSSYDEKEIVKLVRSITDEEILQNKRNIIGPWELDMFLPNVNLAIEYCGLYWHSELAGKTRKYHRNKHELCANKNIKLLTIFEDEWVNKRSIIESMLMNILGGNETKIGARKTTVIKITSKMANDFAEKNHIQGRGRSKCQYGLMFNNELVAVMTFSNSDVSRKSSIWDVNRFCSKLGVNIQGGASKLFSAFLKDYDPDQVVSYADLRWGTGQTYGKLGFVKVSETVPNYWYFKNNKMRRCHRYGLRKRPDEPKDRTEWELRQDEGWNRIWDCGHAKWVFTKTK